MTTPQPSGVSTPPSIFLMPTQFLLKQNVLLPRRSPLHSNVYIFISSISYFLQMYYLFYICIMIIFLSSVLIAFRTSETPAPSHLAVATSPCFSLSRARAFSARFLFSSGDIFRIFVTHRSEIFRAHASIGFFLLESVRFHGSMNIVRVRTH